MDGVDIFSRKSKSLARLLAGANCSDESLEADSGSGSSWLFAGGQLMIVPGVLELQEPRDKGLQFQALLYPFGFLL